MKVIGIGLNKTGTKTLGECMKILGLRNKSYDFDLLKDFSEDNHKNLFDSMDQYDSFEDWPWPLMYKEFDKRYPDAKFILTLRKDPQTWFESLCRHALHTGPTEARKIVYGYEMPLQNEEHHIRFYMDHHRDVMAYFKNRPGKLLVVSWDNGDGWEALCSFLNHSPAPEVPFPHKNKSTIHTGSKITNPGT
jgi:hypothetical protein